MKAKQVIPSRNVLRILNLHGLILTMFFGSFGYAATAERKGIVLEGN